MAENDRCWPGYEPVKGKKPSEKGSCKPEAESNQTSSDKKFRAKRAKQLDHWKEEHPKSSKSAAQHLHAPGAKPKSKKAVKKSSSSTKKVAAKKKKAA